MGAPGARDDAGNYLDRHFRGLGEEEHPNFRWIRLLSDPPAGATRRVGLVTEGLAADLAAYRDGLGGKKVYVAGPPSMVRAAIALLLAKGLTLADIHADGISDDALGGYSEWLGTNGVVQAG